MPSFSTLADPRRRWVRIVSILAACRDVGLTPITTDALHVIAYLSEVLSPTWSLAPIDAKVLKQAESPYFPTLRQDVDRLIGMGMIRVNDIEIVRMADGSKAMQSKFSLNWELAAPLIERLEELPSEAETLDFFRQVVQAFSRLPDEHIAPSMGQDASYGAPDVEAGEVIDLGEWIAARETATSHAMEMIRSVSSDLMNPAQVIDVYVSHIAERVANE